MGKDKISLKHAVSIGIRGMVGGIIFTVLGLTVSSAKGGRPAAFLFARTIALFTALSSSLFYCNLSFGNSVPIR